jgi:hypothetical protein
MIRNAINKLFLNQYAHVYYYSIILTVINYNYSQLYATKLAYSLAQQCKMASLPPISTYLLPTPSYQSFQRSNFPEREERMLN